MPYSHKLNSADYSQRALVHTDGDVLNVNYNTDFEGGTLIHGNATVSGNFTSSNNIAYGKLLQNKTINESQKRSIVIDNGVAVGIC